MLGPFWAAGEKSLPDKHLRTRPNNAGGALDSLFAG